MVLAKLVVHIFFVVADIEVIKCKIGHIWKNIADICL